MPSPLDAPEAVAARRRFLLAALTLPAAAALHACSGAPQNVPPSAPELHAPLPAPPPAAASSPELDDLRAFRLAQGIEPALVFRAAWGR